MLQKRVDFHRKAEYCSRRYKRFRHSRASFRPCSLAKSAAAKVALTSARRRGPGSGEINTLTISILNEWLRVSDQRCQ